MTQNEMVAMALKQGSKLTPKDALRRFGIMRLASRIYELRQQGMKIDERKIQVATDRGTAIVSEYRLAVQQEELFETFLPE
jgi:hypothetical protein